MATDPVCGMVVEENPETLHATVRGTMYYFCSESCLLEFTRPELELRNIKLSLALSLALGIPILILSYVSVKLPVPLGWLLLLLATPVQFIAGWRFYRGTYDALKMRSSNMDILIAIGTSAAYFYSLVYVLFPKQFPFGGLYFDTSAIIIALILTGRLLEYGVRSRASEAIRKLADLQPANVTIVVDGTEKEIPIEKLSPEDFFIVRPGDRIATDGIVVDGHSSVDEKLVTGEGIPVEKLMGNQVIGGTINGQGALKVRATRVGTDTTLSKIVHIVQQAQNSKGPVERLVDTISRYFVPIVVLVALASFLGWTFIAHEPISFGFTTAVAVLIIACPCALGLATPAAIVVGAGKGAENGILIKGGEYLERTQKIDTVVFDKTGTLTRGEPEVTDIVNFKPKEISDDELLQYAAICEKRSEHPLASAILTKAGEEFRGKEIPDPESFESVPGSGVHAVYLGHDLQFGSSRIVESLVNRDIQSKLNELQKQGKTVMILSVDNQIAGLIAAADTVKEHSRETVKALQKMGLKVMMLTGDNRNTAAAIANQVGIEDYVSEVVPAEKYEAIKKLQTEEHRKVAMVGDGVNDAPALAQADVGIAIGSGSDIAIETGGIILMKDDLRDVVAGIQLSRATMNKIKQNLFWAFIYNVGLIPVAAGLFFVVFGVLLNPIFAGLAMAMSSVTVVTNSLNLRRFKPKF
ncbi:MAG: heavy metal translocating P-type ATPase [Thaumarchaeota archaeon]|nr:heavy metal translocating P-type ATPase [Nitrososphaerota archaeon]